MKKALIIILQMGIIIVYTMIGEFAVTLVDIPVPGAIIGMVLLLLSLHAGIVKIRWIEMAGAFLIGEMMLFFIPSVVGFMQYTWMFGISGLLILVILIIGTVIMMAVTGLVSKRMIESSKEAGPQWSKEFSV